MVGHSLACLLLLSLKLASCALALRVMPGTFKVGRRPSQTMSEVPNCHARCSPSDLTHLEVTTEIRGQV